MESVSGITNREPTALQSVPLRYVALNVVRMRASIARRREMPLDETIIVKMALLESCTDIAATEILQDAINASSDGMVRRFFGPRSTPSASSRSRP